MYCAGFVAAGSPPSSCRSDGDFVFGEANVLSGHHFAEPASRHCFPSFFFFCAADEQPGVLMLA